MTTGAITVRPARTARKTGARRVAAVALAAIAALLLVGYLGISAYVADRLSRPELRLPEGNPGQVGLSYRDVEFASAGDNIPLSGWLIDSPGSKAIIMLHGKDMARDRDEKFLEKAALFAGAGYDVLMFDFRAHGLSGGERYSLGQWETRDIEGALAFLKGEGYSEFGTYGVSMGAGISLLAAPSHPEIKALWVDAPFADMEALVDAGLPAASGLPAFFNPGIFFMGKALYGLDFSGVKPVNALASMGDRPVYEVHCGGGDGVIPLSQAHLLEKAGAGNPNYTFWLPPCDCHVCSYTNNTREYTERMLNFYRKHLD